MKQKNLLLFICFYIMCGSSALAHRLIYETQSPSNNIATAVYLEDSTGRLIVQKYTFPKDRLLAQDYRFPKNVKSFASIYHPLTKLRPDVIEENVTIDLNQSSPDIRSKLQKAVGVDATSTNEIMKDLGEELHKNANHLVIPSEGRGTKKNFAIHSSESGKLIFGKGHNTKMALPGNIPFPQDFINSLGSKSITKVDVGTPLEIDLALGSLESLAKTYGFDERQRNVLKASLVEQKSILDKKISSMELVRSALINGVKRELFFDFETGSFYLKKTRDGQLQGDEFYSIIDDKNLSDLKEKLAREGLFNKADFDEYFQDFHVPSCEGLEGIGHLLPELDSNIANILKINNKLWGSYLENAISEKPIILEDGSIVLSLSSLSESHNIKLKLDSNGVISEAKFLDEKKASKEGLKILQVVENGKKIFKISRKINDSPEELDQFFLDSEKNGLGKSTLSVYVRGNGQGQSLYDQNSFDLSLNGSKVISSEKKVQLSVGRKDVYPKDFSKGDGQGVKSFFFRNFFSLESKREKLVDEIKTAVDKQIGTINKDGHVYLDKSEVNDIVLNIVKDVERDIPKLDTDITKLTAKTYEHAYKNFISSIVPKMIRELVPGEDDNVYGDITDKSMIALNICLEKASARSNEKAAEQCLNIYIKEAPVKIGEEVLLFQLKENGQEVLSATAVSEYNKCIKEHYDKSQDMSFVKGCLFKSMFTAVDKDLENVVVLSLKSMEEDYKKNGKVLNLSIEKKTFENSRKDLRNCYEEKGYISPNIFKDNYNQEKLNRLDTDQFKNDLLGCSSKIEQAVGREVSGIIVDSELKMMGIDGEERESIKNTTIAKGYENCINIQNRVADRHAKQGKFKKVEANKCTNLVTLTATELVITKTLREKLGTELWNKLTLKDPSPHTRCFEDLKSLARDVLVDPKAKSYNFEKLSANCLKDSVVWASLHLGKNELSKIFSSDPLYRKIALSDERKDYYAKMIQQCFKEKLVRYHSVSEVSASLEKIQSQCTVSLVMSDSASADILSPIVLGLLEDSGIKSDIIAKTRGTIVDKMRSNVAGVLAKKELSLDEVISEFKKIQGEATYIIADATIDQYVGELVAGPNSSKISSDLRKKIFYGSLNYKDKFLKASSKEEIDFLLASMTELAALDLTEHAARSEGIKLKEKALLKTDREVENLAKNARSYMKKCLSERSDEIELNAYLNTCVAKVKSSVTYDVFDDQLKGILYNGPYAESISKSDKEIIYHDLAGEQLREGIVNAYNTDTLASFQSSFTLKATSSIGEKVLRKSIDDLFIKDIPKTDKRYSSLVLKSEVIADSANNNLQRCLETQKGRTNINTEECINSARFTATSLVFRDKVTPFLSLISDKKLIQDRFINNELKRFSVCTDSKSSSANNYSDAVNGCLVESVFDLVSELIKDSSLETGLMKNIKEGDLSKYRICIEDKKRDLIKSNNDFKNNEDLRKDLYSKIGKREDFWISYFNNTPTENSQKKVDWAIQVVQDCGLSSALPEILKSIRKSPDLKEKLSLTNSEEEYTKNIISKVEVFASDTLKNGLWLKAPDKTKTTNSNESKELELATISSYLEKYMPLFGEHLKKLHSYDKLGSSIAFDRLLNVIWKELNTKGKLSLDELKAILMKSDLIDLLIESEVSSFIIKEAQAPLAREGVGIETIRKLGSKEILGPIFLTKKGQKSISDIKEQFILPMLNGSGAKEIPPKVVRDVKLILASDTRLGGFVETLAGSIVQVKLEEKRPKNYASNGIASLLGYNPQDFLWSSLRTRVESNVSKDMQPVNQALEYFGRDILAPILLNENLGTETKVGFFSKKEVNVLDRRKENFSKMIEGIMGL